MPEILEDINAQLAGYGRELAACIQKGDEATAALVRAEIARLEGHTPETTVADPAPEDVAVEPAPEAWAPPTLETTKA